MSAHKLVMCPYDEVHKVKESRLQLHITKCRLNHLHEDKFECPFNATHVLPRQEKNYHLLHCPDKAPLDRRLAQSIDKNNPFKGRTAVPSYSESTPIISDEVWDDDASYPSSGYIVPAERPPGAIVEPSALSKPAERRALYKQLHIRPTEPETRNSKSPATAITPKEFKQPTEASRLEMLQKESMRNHGNVGLGRGRGMVPSRIAANIFPPSVGSSSEFPNNDRSYSAAIITAGMNQLGLGRGQMTNPVFDPLNLDDDDFPALGLGRGTSRTPRAGIKSPGLSPRV